MTLDVHTLFLVTIYVEAILGLLLADRSQSKIRSSVYARGPMCRTACAPRRQCD
jgi:hypothetical protein